MAQFINIEQLKSALERTKQYTEETYEKLGHVHGSDKITKLTGYTMANDNGDMQITVSASDSLNEAIGKLERSIKNIIDNPGNTQVEKHDHNDLYYTEDEIDDMFGELQIPSKDEILGGAKDYTDKAISDLVGQAPELLDTFEELANALNGDETFADTVIEMISGKLSMPEGTTPGNVMVSNGSGIEDSGFQLGKSVPENAEFTDRKVATSVANASKLYLTGCSGETVGELKYNDSIYVSDSGTLVAPTFEGNATSATTANTALSAETAKKVNNPLVIKVGGATQVSYDGSQSTDPVEITAEALGIAQATDAEVKSMLDTVFGN